MAKFKIGDTVRAKRGAPYRITTNGWVGKIEGILNDESIIVYGEGLCINVPVASKYFDLVYDNRIVITTDGVTTTAKLYDGKKVIKSATAKCSPDDEFDFNIGAKIAFERLNAKRVPHIMYENMDYGEIGKPTKLKDFKGRNLFVGDVVEKLDDEYRSYGLGFVVYRPGDEGFIMGLRDVSNTKRYDGKIVEVWTIAKRKSFEDVTIGETYGKLVVKNVEE